jgi:hypothetical protein
MNSKENKYRSQESVDTSSRSATTSPASRALRAKLNYEEWKLFKSFQQSVFFQSSSSNQRRIELRVLLAELAYQIKLVSPAISRDAGTYDVLLAAQSRSPKKFLHMKSFVKSLKSTIVLDTYLEHSDHPTTDQRWLTSLRDIDHLAQDLSADSLSNLCRQLKNMEYNANKEHQSRNDFLPEIWLQCQHLQHISGQRQSLITNFINMAGADIRSKGLQKLRSHHQHRLQFQKGDKEAFKAMKDPLVRSALVIRNVRNVTQKIYDAVELRGRRRHVVRDSGFSRQEMQDELGILIDLSFMTNNKDLEKITKSAWKAYDL